MRHLPLGEDVIMDPTLPAELLQSYVRLLFKAWDGQFLNSATLTMAELRALWGSGGRLAIAVREGSALRDGGIARGDPVVALLGGPPAPSVT